MPAARPLVRRTARFLRPLFVVGGLAVVLIPSLPVRADDDAPADKGELLKEAKPPATGPATKPAAVVSPAARAELDAIRDAYRGLGSLKLAGTISADLDINGDRQKYTAGFRSAFEAPAKFRLATAEAGGDAKPETLVVGSTGDKLYVFQPLRKRYQTADAPKTRVPVGKLDSPYADLLSQQDPSLLLALSEDPAAQLLDGTKAVYKADDVRVGDAAYTALTLTEESGDAVTLLIDPKTHLLRRFTFDLRKSADPKGEADVKKAEVTIDYADVAPAADVKAESFAWAPPAGARQVSAGTAAALRGDGDSYPAMDLEGKPAPPFKLKGLDGEEVALADLKGSVVLLDFWATWCGPCRESLPHLGDIYKAKSAAGLKAFAIDVDEEKEIVQKFVKDTNLALPVLLDSEKKASEAYKVQGIPQTVVVGKDGKIKKVFIGSGSHEEVRKAVEEAMK